MSELPGNPDCRRFRATWFILPIVLIQLAAWIMPGHISDWTIFRIAGHSIALLIVASRWRALWWIALAWFLALFAVFAVVSLAVWDGVALWAIIANGLCAWILLGELIFREELAWGWGLAQVADLFRSLRLVFLLLIVGFMFYIFDISRRPPQGIVWLVDCLALAGLVISMGSLLTRTRTGLLLAVLFLVYLIALDLAGAAGSGRTGLFYVVLGLAIMCLLILFRRRRDFR